MKLFGKWFTCLFKGHVIADDSAVQEMLAVYRGGICERCLRPVRGTFICNYWNPEETVIEGSGERLRGINPILREGRYVIRDWETVQEVSDSILNKESPR